MAIDDEDYMKVEQRMPAWYTRWIMQHPVVNSLLCAVIGFVLGAIVF